MSPRSSGSDALAAALRLLAVRDRSAGEIAVRLRRRGHDEEEIASVLGRCRELGYLDDARFARERARQLLASGRAVGPRILADLAGRGVEGEQARDALQEVAADFPEESLLRDLLRRRFPGFDFAAAEDRERRRVVSHFLRRGFSISLVLSILKEER